MNSADWATVLTALLGTVSATLSAYFGYLANRRIRTNGGHTIGEHVETIGEHVETLATKIEALEKLTPPESPTPPTE
jgi:hypothetical protein